MSDQNGADFGCVRCRATPKDHASLVIEHERVLYEDCHEDYALERCPECGQAYLRQFQEITRLPDGRDDIWLRWAPLTVGELAEVESLFPAATEDYTHVPRLAALLRNRRRLVRDPDDRFDWNDGWDAGNLMAPV